MKRAPTAEGPRALLTRGAVMAGDFDKGESARADADRREPDAHGRAALLLVESLIHALIEKSVLTVGEAVEVLEIAVEVNTEIAADQEGTSAMTLKSLHLLEVIGRSLRTDLAGS